MSKSYWLMKTEPDAYSFEDLCSAPERTDGWDGIRNYQARNFLRDDFACGDEVFIYHSRVKEPAIVGLARVVRSAYPDQTALDPEEKYFDARAAKKGVSPWVMVDIQATARLSKPISLKQLKAYEELAELPLLQKGQRLSIQPVAPEHWTFICSLAEISELV